MKVLLIIALALVALAHGLSSEYDRRARNTRPSRGLGYWMRDYEDDEGHPVYQRNVLNEGYAAPARKRRNPEEDHAAMGHVVYRRNVLSQSYAAPARKRRTPEEDHEAMGHLVYRRNVLNRGYATPAYAPAY